MIKKYKQFNESLLNKIEGPNKEEIWKNLGYDRKFDTPEDFFLDIIKGMKVIEQTKFTDSVFWEKNGEILFHQDLKNRNLYVNYNRNWKIFENVFGMGYNETQLFIKDMVEKYLNWKDFTPRTYTGNSER